MDLRRSRIKYFEVSIGLLHRIAYDGWTRNDLLYLRFKESWDHELLLKKKSTIINRWYRRSIGTSRDTSVFMFSGFYILLNNNFVVDFRHVFALGTTEIRQLDYGKHQNYRWNHHSDSLLRNIMGSILTTPIASSLWNDTVSLFGLSRTVRYYCHVLSWIAVFWMWRKVDFHLSLVL